MQNPSNDENHEGDSIGLIRQICEETFAQSYFPPAAWKAISYDNPFSAEDLMNCIKTALTEPSLLNRQNGFDLVTEAVWRFYMGESADQVLWSTISNAFNKLKQNPKALEAFERELQTQSSPHGRALAKQIRHEISKGHYVVLLAHSHGALIAKTALENLRDVWGSVECYSFGGICIVPWYAADYVSNYTNRLDWMGMFSSNLFQNTSTFSLLEKSQEWLTQKIWQEGESAFENSVAALQEHELVAYEGAIRKACTKGMFPFKLSIINTLGIGVIVGFGFFARYLFRSPSVHDMPSPFYYKL
jgi:hypothetical protein